MLRYRVIASVPAAFYAEREICHVSRGVLFSVEVHFTPLDSHRNWQPLAQQIPRKATHHNNRSEREKERWCLYQDKEGDSPSVMKHTQIAVARSSECGRGMSDGAVDRRSYRHDTLALRGRKVAAYQTKLRFGFCGVYIDRE
jgi:hypothetical protein